MTPTTEPVTAATLEQIPLTQLDPHPINRERFDIEKLDELVDSVAKHGVITPLLVRPFKGVRYQIIAGERRFKAAKTAGLTSVPCTVRQLSDDDAVELVVIENLHREDVHPLEEARGYVELLKTKRYTRETLAAKIGKSEAYIRDRLVLSKLIPQARKLFLENVFSASHAVLLARLTSADQERALKAHEVGDGYRAADGAVFERERVIDDNGNLEGDDFEDDPVGPVKPRTVRELKQWIDDQVRFVPGRDADPDLFPETATDLELAKKAETKIIPITFEYVIADAAKTKERVYTERSWRMADPERDAEACEHSVLGYVAIGPHRGESFPVCIARDRCLIHFKEEIQEKQKRERAKASGKQPAGEEYREDRDKAWEREERKRAAVRAQWKAAYPKLLEAVIAKVAKMSTTAGGAIAKHVLEPRGTAEKALLADLKPKTADDILRALMILDIAENIDEHTGPYNGPRTLGKLGIDWKRILEEATPKETPAVARAGG